MHMCMHVCVCVCVEGVLAIFVIDYISKSMQSCEKNAIFTGTKPWRGVCRDSATALVSAWFVDASSHFQAQRFFSSSLPCADVARTKERGHGPESSPGTSPYQNAKAERQPTEQRQWFCGDWG